jgi:prevent-host-death family protein
MRASAKDMRFHSREILHAVARGEEVIITFRGRPRAKIVPLQNASPSATAEPRRLFGLWKDNPAVANVNRYIRKIRQGRFP